MQFLFFLVKVHLSLLIKPILHSKYHCHFTILYSLFIRSRRLRTSSVKVTL